MYGGYGGLGGMGSSYSSYGSYSGLGSSYGGYGGGLGSSYGGLGGSDRLRRTQSEARPKKDTEDPQDSNKPTEQMRPQQNPDKKVVQQWFKMMGGLRSILELGFAFLALTNFCMTTSQLLKKFFAFSKQTSISMARYIEGKVPTKTISNMMSPQRRTKTLKMLAINTMRMFAAFLLVLGLKTQRNMRRDAKKKHEEMMSELQKLKENEVQMQDQSEIEARRRDEGVNHDANL